MKRAITRHQLAGYRTVLQLPAGTKPLHVYTGDFDDSIWITVEQWVETSEPPVPHLIVRAHDDGSALPRECSHNVSQFIGAVEVFPGFHAHLYWCDMLRLHESEAA